MRTRRQFSREFKVEAVKLVAERGVSISQAARDLDLGETVLRRWVRELTADPQQAFPGNGVLERLVIEAKSRRITVVDRRGPLGTNPKVLPG